MIIAHQRLRNAPVPINDDLSAFHRQLRHTADRVISASSDDKRRLYFSQLLEEPETFIRSLRYHQEAPTAGDGTGRRLMDINHHYQRCIIVCVMFAHVYNYVCLLSDFFNLCSGLGSFQDNFPVDYLVDVCMDTTFDYYYCSARQRVEWSRRWLKREKRGRRSHRGGRRAFEWRGKTAARSAILYRWQGMN